MKQWNGAIAVNRDRLKAKSNCPQIVYWAVDATGLSLNLDGKDLVALTNGIDHIHVFSLAKDSVYAI